MDAQSHARLVGWRHAFDDPVATALAAAVVCILVAAPLVVLILRRRRHIGDKLHRELSDRIRSWWIIAPLMIVPLMLGALWIILGVAVVSLLCYREFARATGLFRHRMISAIVVIGIIALSFAVLDHWYGLFVAIPPLIIGVISAVAIAPDRPQGYLQRVALAATAFLLIGLGLAHLGFLANDRGYRSILLWLLAAVQLNDVFAFICGKSFGRRKLAPNTSPNKTIGGAVGALVLTTVLATAVGHFVFHSTDIDRWHHLIILGILISVGGMLGDLVLSSIKRDLGIKDMGTLIPGHGGLLDRVNSLLLVAPAVFHYINYFAGIGADQPRRIFTGS